MHKPNIFISFDSVGVQNFEEYSKYLNDKIDNFSWARDSYLITKAKADSLMRLLPSPNSIAYEIEKLRIKRQLNTYFANALRDMTIAYLVTLNDEYALKIKQILLSFPENINPIDEVHKIEKLNKHHLTYCSDWIPKMIFAFDVIKDFFTEDESNVMLDFFDKSADVIKNDENFKYWKDHNRGTWHQSALGLIGLVTKNQKYIDKAVKRIEYQLENYLPSDGIWWEGSIHVHYFFLYAIINFLIPASHNGIDLLNFKNSDNNGIKTLFDSPLQLANPEGVIPANNDRGHRSIYSPCYEIGYYLYRDPVYASIVDFKRSRDFRNNGQIDESIFDSMFGEATLLLYGICYIEKSAAQDSKSLIYKDCGWGILKSNKSQEKYYQGSTLYAFLDFGPHGGSHGHADKLNLYIYGNKKEFTFDERWFNTFETLINGENIHADWTKKSLSHNTVMIDETCQLGAKFIFDAEGASGKLQFFDVNDDIKVIKADAKDAYPNIELLSYSRMIAVTDTYFIDIFDIKSNAEHIYDWTFHAMADDFTTEDIMWESADPKKEFSLQDGYEWLFDVSKADTNSTWKTYWDNGLITFMGDSGSKVLYKAKGLRGFDCYMPLIIDRRKGKNAQFSAVHFIKDFSNITDIKIKKHETYTVVNVFCKNYDDIFIYNENGTGKWSCKHHDLTIKCNGIYGYKRITHD